MKSVIDLIESNTRRYPEFEEYIPNIEEAVVNVSERPDRCIENCKALFEGFFRTFILKLNSDGLDRRTVYNWRFERLVNRGITELRRIDPVNPSPLPEIKPLLKLMNRVRNDRGDVSHGRAAPKIDRSDKILAEFILRFSEANLGYMLRIFYDQSGVIVEPELAHALRYEDNQEFNEYLDRYNDPVGPYLHSEALFYIENDVYLRGLDDWRVEQNERAEILRTIIQGSANDTEDDGGNDA